MYSLNVNCRHCLVDHCGLCVNPTCLCRQSHSKRELLNSFTETASRLLPSSPEQLKQILREEREHEEREDQEAVYQNKFEIYKEANDEQRFAKDLVSDIAFPGHLFKGKESCGKWKIKGHIHRDGHGFIRKTELHCHNRGCNTCWVSSVKREAGSITDRVVALRNLKNNDGVYLNRKRKRVLNTLVVSLPKNKCDLMLTRKGRQEARDYTLNALKKLDIDGGVMIDHPYRFNEEKTNAFFSPHFHFIITGWANGKTISKMNKGESEIRENKNGKKYTYRGYEKFKGIIIKVGKSKNKLKEKEVNYLKTRKNVFNYASYVLSHTAVYLKPIDKRSPEHSLRYFGECQNRKFKVDSILRRSQTGYDQIDNILKDKAEKSIKQNGRRVLLALQKVTYTHSIIENDIKFPKEELFSVECNGSINEISRSVKVFIKPYFALEDINRDNPALCESVPFEFLQMRFDYGYSQYDIVQSEYSNIILDGNLDELCPEDSEKMEVLVPIDRGCSEVHLENIAELVKSLPLDITVPLDDMDKMFSYRRDQAISYKGLEYFNFEGMRQYDSGVYSKPDCLLSLNPSLYFGIVTYVKVQTFKNMVKVGYGRQMKRQEYYDYSNNIEAYIDSLIHTKSAYHKPLECFI